MEAYFGQASPDLLHVLCESGSEVGHRGRADVVTDDEEDEGLLLGSGGTLISSLFRHHQGRFTQRPNRRAHFGLLPSLPPPKSPRLTSNTVLSNPIFAPWYKPI